MIENGLESPLDELEHLSVISEIPAYKSANQELAGVLKNLRKMEQHLKGMNYHVAVVILSPELLGLLPFEGCAFYCIFCYMKVTTCIL